MTFSVRCVISSAMSTPCRRPCGPGVGKLLGRRDHRRRIGDDRLEVETWRHQATMRLPLLALADEQAFADDRRRASCVSISRLGIVGDIVEQHALDAGRIADEIAGAEDAISRRRWAAHRRRAGTPPSGSRARPASAGRATARCSGIVGARQNRCVQARLMLTSPPIAPSHVGRNPSPFNDARAEILSAPARISAATRLVSSAKPAPESAAKATMPSTGGEQGLQQRLGRLDQRAPWSRPRLLLHQ